MMTLYDLTWLEWDDFLGGPNPEVSFLIAKFKGLHTISVTHYLDSTRIVGRGQVGANKRRR
jgi:hypothetical protein